MLVEGDGPGRQLNAWLGTIMGRGWARLSANRWLARLGVRDCWNMYGAYTGKTRLD
jgi:hypothetical protein